MSISKKLILHPFLIALYPILFLLSNNISQINIKDAPRPLFIGLLVALIFFLIFSAISKDYYQGGLSTSLLLGLFFTYGHVYYILGLKDHTLLLLLWGLLLLIGMIAKYKIQNIYQLTQTLNIIFLFLLLQPIATISVFVLKSGSVKAVSPQSPFENIATLSDTDSDYPDIYYIIPDAYGRTDVLDELYEYDNSEFINYLKEKGFYVAEQSHSNYIQTALSLSSSMNFNYIENLIETDTLSTNKDPLKELLSHSELRRVLEDHGYTTVNITAGYEIPNISDADISISHDRSFVNNLEELILTTSASLVLEENLMILYSQSCEQKRETMLEIFEYLKKVPALPGPKFVFVHILSPHPDFAFDAEGNAAKDGLCPLQDGNHFRGSDADYKDGYSQQIAYTTLQLQESIDYILRESSRPPVIIVQGDHGPGMFLDWESSERTCLLERTSILNAYYLPFAGEDILYETITPVNSFRVVLNEIFDQEMPLLDDKIFFSLWERPYQLNDITDKIESSCTPTTEKK